MPPAPASTESTGLPCCLPSRRLIRLNPAEHLEYRWLPAVRAAAQATSWTNRDAIRWLSGLG